MPSYSATPLCSMSEWKDLLAGMNENIPSKLKHLSSQKSFLDAEEIESAHTGLKSSISDSLKVVNLGTNTNLVGTYAHEL